MNQLRQPGRNVGAAFVVLLLAAGPAAAAPAGPPPRGILGQPPSFRQWVRTEVYTFTEHGGIDREQTGCRFRFQAPVSRTVLADLAAGWETHRLPAPPSARFTVRRLDLGARTRWSEAWSGIGGVSLMTAAEHGTPTAPTLTTAGRFFLARRYSDRFTLLFGGLVSERMHGEWRWLAVPGIQWRPHPDLTIRTADGISADLRLGDGDSLSLRVQYRRQAYGLEAHDGGDRPSLTVSGLPVTLNVRRRAASGAWLDIGGGFNVRPRETLSDADGRRMGRHPVSPHGLLRLAAGIQF